MLQIIYKKFNFLSRKTSLKKELIGGLITFFAMVYILPVNSNIISNGGRGIPYGGVFIATALVAAIGSMLIGFFSNLPIGIAPGMGSNIFFVSTMIKQFNLSWEVALAIVFLNGLIFTTLAISGFIEKFIKSMPSSIKHAFIVGLGIYLALIGLKSSNIAVISPNGFELGDLSNVSVILTLLGILLVFILTIKKVNMAILYTMLFLSIIGMIIGQIIENHKVEKLSAFTDIKFNYNQFKDFTNVFGKGLIKIPQALTNIKTYPSLLALIFMTLSGATGTIISVGQSSFLLNQKGEIEGTKKAAFSIGIASTLSGVLGTSPANGFLESNAGVKFGARTGVSSIFIGLLFLLSIPLFPILEPLFNHHFVTSPILIFVGSMMMKNVKQIKWKDPAIGASSFILVITMWFTSSILNGLAFGLVSYTIFQIVKGNWKKINIYVWMFSFLFLAYIISIPFINLIN